MIWHIFRKDCKLLWRIIIGVGLVNLAYRAIQSAEGPLGRFQLSSLILLAGMLMPISLLATGFLIVAAVQQDAIPGVSEDWLVRPIRRRDLLWGKILFVALMVQGPILVMEVGQCLAGGFPLGRSLAAPLSRSLWMLLVMDLPVLAFATLTRNLAQAAGAAIGIVLGFAIFTTAAQLYGYFGFDKIWVCDLLQLAWGLIGVAIVLALQYYRRKTTPARWVYGAATLVCLCVQFLPWNMAFAIEKRFSPLPAAADVVQIVSDPAFGKYHGRDWNADSGGATRIVDVWAPLRVNGVREDQMLNTDKVSAGILEIGGTKIDFGRQPRPIPWDARGSFHYLIGIPEDIYNRFKNVPVAIEIDYSMTLLQANVSQSLPASGGDHWIEGLGRCATRANAGDSQVQLGCLFPGNSPCFTWSLMQTGRQRATGRGCSGDSAPYVGRVDGDSISHFGIVIANKDAVPLPEMQVALTAYRPEALFTRQVVIRNIRLSDWRPE